MIGTPTTITDQPNVRKLAYISADKAALETYATISQPASRIDRASGSRSPRSDAHSVLTRCELTNA